MRIFQGLFILLIISALVGYAPVNAAPQILTASQIQALFPGIYEGIADEKYDFIVSGGTNGQLIGRAKGIEKTLPWKISGNKLCITISEDEKTKTFCSRIAREGAWYKAIKDDGSSQVKFKPYKKK